MSPLPAHTTPLYPKRHLVALRSHPTEPQTRLARQERTINPWILQRLRVVEDFNLTNGDRPDGGA